MRTRITLTTLMLIGASIATPGAAPAGQQTKYGVSVKESKPAALANVKTYRWTETHPSFEKTIDAQIIVAVDRELQARGLRKLAAGPCDLLVTYSSLSRTDVDLKSPTALGESSELAVGTLIVDLRDPSNRSSLFRVRMDTPIETDRARLEAIINAGVAAMFEKYPRAAAR
jgi:hypothetical protein